MLESIDFAGKKGGKVTQKKACVKGDSCGFTCIRKGLVCRSEMKAKEKEFAGYLKKSAGTTKGKAKAASVDKAPVAEKKVKKDDIPDVKKETIAAKVDKKKEAAAKKDDIPDVKKETIAAKVDKKKEAAAKKDDIPDVKKETIAAKVDRRRGGKHTDIPVGTAPPSASVSYSWKKDAGGVERYYKNETRPDGSQGKVVEISRKELNSIVETEFNGDFKAAKFGRDLRPEAETKKLEEKARSKQLSAIKKLSGLSEDEAKASIDAIKKYSEPEGDVVGYGAIRNVQRGILKTADGRDLTKGELSEVESSIKSINQYLEKMPSFDGAIHRGMSFDSKADRDAFVSKISGGYSLEAMSSFSSSKNTAKDFATQAGSGILFTVKNKSGVSIKRLSQVEEENEVLVPKDTRYRIVGTPKKAGNVVVVQMEEF
jgi:hypothetical protein